VSKVIIYSGFDQTSNEAKVAGILANYFDRDVTVLKPVNRFKIRTPDYVIDGVFYELKTIKSPKANKVEDRIKEAVGQANRIVIDIRSTRIHENRASEIIHEIIKKNKKIHQVLLIASDKRNQPKILDFKR